MLDDLGIDRADFFGFSLGGLIALRLAMRHPGQAGRLVATGVHFSGYGYHPEIFEMDPGSKRLPTEADFQQMHDAYLAVAPDPGRFKEFEAKASPVVERLDWSAEDLGSITAAVLIIIGDLDFVRIEHAARLRELIPDAALAVLPNTTHLDLVRRTDLVLPLVKDFLI